MQFSSQAKPPIGIIFDSDMGASIGDALALALLCGLEGKSEARVVSVSVSQPSLKAAAFCEVLRNFYAGGMYRGLPVGLSTVGKTPDDTPMLAVPLSNPAYRHGIRTLNDTAEAPAVIRNSFTAQHDQNAVVVLAGPATNLAGVLALPGARDLIAQKVRFLSMAAWPVFDNQADVAAARRLLAEWPVPIVACSAELSAALTYPAASIEKDFAWSPAHPLVDAYNAYRSMPYDAPAGEMAAVLHAVRPQEGYFKLSEPGTITIGGDGRTSFAPSAGGRHKFLALDPAQKDRVVKTCTEIVSAKPVPRRPRFPG